jgi:hypothetical protein
MSQVVTIEQVPIALRAVVRVVSLLQPLPPPIRSSASLHALRLWLLQQGCECPCGEQNNSA